MTNEDRETLELIDSLYNLWIEIPEKNRLQRLDDYTDLLLHIRNTRAENTEVK